MAQWRHKDELFRKLARLAPAASKAATESSRQTADEMAELARSFVPVRTGALRDSIVVTGPGETTPAYSQGGGRAVPAGAYAVSAGNDKVRYSHMVEFGTSAHDNAGRFVGTRNPGSRRQPFFWVSYRLVRKKLRARVSRALNKAIRDA